MPLDRAGTPRQGYPCFDRRIVALETLCDALKRGQRARCRLLPPRLELLRLPGLEELRTAVSEPDRRREGSLRVVQAGEQVLLFRGHVLGLAPRQPGRLAWREALHGGIGHRRPRLPRARPWGQPLGLAELRKGAEHGRSSAPLSLTLQLLLEPHTCPTPPLPAGEPIRLGGIEHTCGACPDREAVGSDILRHGSVGLNKGT